MSEPTVIINATVGLSEIIKATAHQRIAAMEQEIERQKEIAAKAMAEHNELDEKIANDLLVCAPPHIDSFVSAALDAMGGMAVWAWWDAKNPDDDGYTIRVDACYGGHRTKDVFGITDSVEFRVKRWEPTPEITAMMARAVELVKTNHDATEEAMRLSNLLRARDFRDRLEGELMSRFIEGQAPDIARQIAAVATDTNSPRLIGVK